MNSIKRLALTTIAAVLILMGVSPAASDGVENQGNFNPTASLDISQVEAQHSSAVDMFCYDSHTDMGWDCFYFENIPADYNDERPVWAGPVNEIRDAYNELH